MYHQSAVHITNNCSRHKIYQVGYKISLLSKKKKQINQFKRNLKFKLHKGQHTINRSNLALLTPPNLHSDKNCNKDRLISFLKYEKPKPIRVRNRRNTNWSTYEEELQGKIGLWFGKVENPADIERELTKISSTIITSFERACPEKRIRRKKTVFHGGTAN